MRPLSHAVSPSSLDKVDITSGPTGRHHLRHRVTI